LAACQRALAAEIRCCFSHVKSCSRSNRYSWSLPYLLSKIVAAKFHEGSRRSGSRRSGSRRSGSRKRKQKKWKQKRKQKKWKKKKQESRRSGSRRSGRRRAEAEEAEAEEEAEKWKQKKRKQKKWKQKKRKQNKRKKKKTEAEEAEAEEEAEEENGSRRSGSRRSGSRKRKEEKRKQKKWKQKKRKKKKRKQKKRNNTKSKQTKSGLQAEGQPDAPSSAAAAYRQRSEAVKFAALSDLPTGMANLLRPEREARFQEASEEVARLDYELREAAARERRTKRNRAVLEMRLRHELDEMDGGRGRSVGDPADSASDLSDPPQPVFQTECPSFDAKSAEASFAGGDDDSDGAASCDDTEALRHKKGHRNANGTGGARVANLLREDGDSNSSDCETELPIETDYELYRLRSSEAKQLAEIEARLQAMSPNRHASHPGQQAVPAPVVNVGQQQGNPLILECRPLSIDHAQSWGSQAGDFVVAVGQHSEHHHPVPVDAVIVLVAATEVELQKDS
uniref:OTU domain-containing protein n=1 Tax=Macrostomum lignano TaxID=282301 RepID=A0A1I8F696_9PLAT